MKESIKNSNIINEIADRIEWSKLNENQKWKLFNIAKWEKCFNINLKEKSTI